MAIEIVDYPLKIVIYPFSIMTSINHGGMIPNTKWDIIGNHETKI